MWSHVMLLSFMVYFAFGDIETVKGKQYTGSFKVGSRVRLDLGPGVKRWLRRKNDGTVESVRYCASKRTGPGCDEFVDVETNMPAFPHSKVLVFPNGTLIFKSMRESDGVALYYSPDLKPKVVNNPDGTMWAVPPKQIYLALA
ncbi:hypothetical protein Aduo_006504 [Ancylostoma duodenale]